ncbi:MAG: hypothetical protein DRG59_05005 [Deltaproteobacteria bacterium]|nr:MAG: hypothetical protein DRG59_05005 [Deltaproteobacteria bacterium]
MVLEALAKSMKLEIAKTEVATPPGNAFLTLWYATDVPVPKNWTVQFFMEKENHRELKDYYGHKIDIPIIRKLQGNGVSFFRVDALPPGKYVAFVSANMAMSSRYDSQKVVFKVVKGERLNSTNPRASEVVKPTEGQITGSMPIFRILWDKRPNFNNNLILRIEYSKDASKYPYELLREERVPGNDWVYDEGARTYGKWVKLKDFDADYRVRVALDNQVYDMHRPQWGTWRHFKARLGRKFEIIEPKKAMQTYGYDTPDDIPIKIKLPSSMREKMTLVMTYYWMESTLDPVGTELFSYEETIVPGQQMYKGAIGKGFLINEKFKKVGGGNPYHGFFRLYVRTKPDNPDMTGYRDFNIVGQEEQGADFSHAADLLPPIIIPLKLHYRTMEDVGIQMRHAGKVKPEFQLRFRPSANNSYTMLPHVTHRFTTSDDITTLHLKFRKPGQYQIRFRSGKGGRWGSWHGFEVVTSEVAGLKTVKPMTQNRLKMPLAPPVIETPRERQAFMLMGREVLVSSRIRHAADAKVEVEIQHGTHGRFSPVKVKLDKRAGKTVSMFTMHLTKTGDYRFRAKLASVPNAPWGMWRTFRVDRLNQKPIYKMKPQSPKKSMTVPFNRINSNPSGIIGK